MRPRRAVRTGGAGRPRTRPTTLDGWVPSGIVAIVGRPNVGKSTLFNRLTGERRAIVDEHSGLTRDRLYGVAEWAGRRFTVVDTAGLDPAVESTDAAEDLAGAVQRQARAAIDEADVCCLVVDVRAGVTPLDEEVAAVLRRSRRPVVLVGNKADSPVDPFYGHELHRLGLGEPVVVSALHGTDVGDLCERILAALPPEQATGVPLEEELRVAIVGRPNVGKSSLLNRIVGAERVVVAPTPGTTRDAIDTVVTHGHGRVRLVDTAGIRRRGAVSGGVERYSVLRAVRALERSDVAIVVVDAAEGVVAQDQHVAGYAADAGKGLVIALNKWDLVDAARRADPHLLDEVRRAFDFVPQVPVVTTSALVGRNVDRLLDAAFQVAWARATRVPTPALNRLLRTAFDEHPPRLHQGRRLHLLYATQARSAAPTFVLFVNDPELLHFSYRRYLENRLRAVFGFAGVPVRIVARPRDQGNEVEQ